MLPSGPRPYEILKTLRNNAVGTQVQHGDWVEARVGVALLYRYYHVAAGAAGGCRSRGASGGSCAVVAAAASCGSSTGIAIGTAASGDDRTHQRGGQTNDRAALHEVATADFVLGIGLDQVELDRPHLAPSAIE